MRVAIFSDVHGNYIALQKFFYETEGRVHFYIFCGDIVGYYNDLEPCIDLIRNKTNIYSVCGNHDRYYCREAGNPYYIKKYGSSYAQRISNENFDWLNCLPERLDITINSKRITVVHGGLGDYLEDRIYPDTVITKTIESDIVFCGHTHYRMSRMSGKTHYVNVGSLGQPRDGKGYSYGVYDSLTNEIEFRNVDIDSDDILERLIKSESNSELIEYLKGKMK